MNEQRDQGIRNERTRSTDTTASITAEIVEDLAAMKEEVGTLLDDDNQHNIKHTLLNRVTALQGAIDLMARKMDTCDRKDGCPLREIVQLVATPVVAPDEIVK